MAAHGGFPGNALSQRRTHASRNFGHHQRRGARLHLFVGHFPTLHLWLFLLGCHDVDCTSQNRMLQISTAIDVDEPGIDDDDDDGPLAAVLESAEISFPGLPIYNCVAKMGRIKLPELIDHVDERNERQGNILFEGRGCEEMNDMWL